MMILMILYAAQFVKDLLFQNLLMLIMRVRMSNEINTISYQHGRIIREKMNYIVIDKVVQ
jgi:hypothetical protein